jgi:hypothetical protein
MRPTELGPPLRFALGLVALGALAAHAAPGPAKARGTLDFALSSVLVGGNPQRVEAAELDGDGDVDLALISANAVASSLASWRNDGPSGFSLHWQKALPGMDPGTLLDLDLGDLDKDGALDLVHCVMHGHHQSHLNAGDGSFPTSFGILSAGGRTTHALADLDADGALDLAYHDFDLGGYLGVQLGDSDGTFSLLQLESLGGPPTYMVRSALCDGNGDGQLDFALASSFGLQLARGVVAGGLPSWSSPVQLLLAGACRDVEAADLDRDGLTDLVVSQPEVDRLCVLRALHGGGFAAPEFVPFGLQPESLALADFDGDGLLDLAAASTRRHGRVYVRLSLPGGGYAPLWQQTVARAAADLSAGDLDGDGDADLVVADPIGGRLVLLANQLIP